MKNTDAPVDPTPLRKIGDPVWVYDGNRRVYPKDGGSAIWREHWEQKHIVGETSRSWLVAPSYVEQYNPRFGCLKVPKVGPTPRGVCFSEAELDRLEWVENNRYRIKDAVGYCTDYETLRAIEALVKPKEIERGPER